MLLAIDTSTSQASIALVATPSAMGDADEAARLLAELTWDVGQRHSAELLPRLRWLFGATSTTPADVSLVAVALGPGSFNGLRVALASAKSLAFALNVPVVGISTLDVVAWGAHLAQPPLWAILDAGRGQVYAASYPGANTQPDAWQPREGPAILTPQEVAERVATVHAPDANQRIVTLAGEWRSATREALAEALMAHGLAPHFVEDLGGRRASWLARLALARAAQGQYDDAMSIEPLYLRRPAITQPGPRRSGQHSGQGSARHAVDGKPGQPRPEGETHRGDREAPEATDGEESSRALRS